MAAALINGCTLITRYSDATPDWIRQNSLEAATPEKAVALLFGEGVPDETLQALHRRAGQVADRFDWSIIARNHIGLYEEILRSGHSG